MVRKCIFIFLLICIVSVGTYVDMCIFVDAPWRLFDMLQDALKKPPA